MSDEEKAFILSRPHKSTAVPWYKRPVVVGVTALVVGVGVGLALGRGDGDGAVVDLGCDDGPKCVCAEQGATSTVASVPQHRHAPATSGKIDVVAPESNTKVKMLKQIKPPLTAEEAAAHAKVRGHHPNIVNGFIDPKMSAFETPAGVGNADSPGACREYADNAKEHYVAWAWVNSYSDIERLRNSCLMYREVVPFEGYPGDHAHIMGCTSFDVSPANGCKLESTAMAATGEPAAKHEVATAVSEPGVPKTEEVEAVVEPAPQVRKTRPNIVRGMLGLNVAYETPLGRGQSTSGPGECRDFAAEHNYVAFAYANSEANDLSLRSTCLFYKEIVPFAGYEEPTLITGCTASDVSPLHACADENATSAIPAPEPEVSTTPAKVAEPVQEPVNQPSDVPSPVPTNPEPVAHQESDEVLVPDESSSNPNIVHGLIGLDQADFATPLGTGTAKSPADCRKYALEPSHAFRAWAWISNDSDEEDMRETCLFYDTIVPFAGRWDDKAHMTGCTDRKFSPQFACER